MVASKVTIDDIRNIGYGGKLKVELPDYAACASAKSLVYYVRRMYPREDGKYYYCTIDSATNTVEISVIDTPTEK
jgi:hypothetical protein